MKIFYLPPGAGKTTLIKKHGGEYKLYDTDPLTEFFCRGWDRVRNDVQEKEFQARDAFVNSIIRNEHFDNDTILLTNISSLDVQYDVGVVYSDLVNYAKRVVTLRKMRNLDFWVPALMHSFSNISKNAKYIITLHTGQFVTLKQLLATAKS